MEVVSFRGDDDFYLLINDYDKLFNTLINKGYLHKLPKRCTNCRRFNTMAEKKRKINVKKPINEQTSYERNDIDYISTYRCKK